MEELYAAENPESLVPQSAVRRQEVSLVEEKSDMASSHFDNSDLEEDWESADLSAKEEMPKELIISGLLLVFWKMTDYNTCPVVPAKDWLKSQNAIEFK